MGDELLMPFHVLTSRFFRLLFIGVCLPGGGQQRLVIIAMVVGLVFIFTALSIFSLLVGDILMTIIDPRIKLTSKGGK